MEKRLNIVRELKYSAKQKKQLKRISDMLPILDVYGNDKSHGKKIDANYASIMYSYFLMSTNEKLVFISFMKDFLGGSDFKANGKSLLEIGPADGEIMLKYAPKFSSVHTIEGDESCMGHLKYNLQKIEKYGVRVHTPIKGYFPQVRPDCSDFGFVLMSHNLYYCPRELWTKIVSEAYEMLSEQGQLMVVLHGDAGDVARMTRQFGGNPDDINGFYHALAKINKPSDYKIYSYDTIQYAFELRQAMHLAGFFLFDANCAVKSEDLADYCNSNFCQNGKNYAIKKTDKILVMTK